MAGKTPEECIANIEANLAALKSHYGNGESESDEPEMSERPVGRGRKRRMAPTFAKKGDDMEESEY